MKTFFIFSFFLYSTTTLACSGKVDPNKIVLFVDTNASFMEAESAKKAACARGETFEMIPASLEQSKKMGQAHIALVHALKKVNNSNCWGSNPTATCKDLLQQVSKMEKERNLLKNSLPKLSPKSMDAKIKALAGSNKAIQSVVFSGHDGGGSIHGELGGVDKTDFFKSMNTSYAKKPALLKEFRSALMWGCFTSTPQEVAEWKANFPGLKIMAGFYGIGPSNTRASSSDIMEDLLKKEDKIISKDQSHEVKAMLTQLQSIQNTNPGIYAMTECGKDYYYYKDNSAGQFGAFSQFATCDSIDQYGKLELFNKYYGGEVDIPVATQGTELRSLYNFVRQNAQCFNAIHPLDGDHVGNLLFFNGVKANFGNVFSNVTQAAQVELKGLGQELNLQMQSHELNIIDSVFGNETKEKHLAEISTFKAHLATVQKNFFFPTTANLKAKSRGEILKNIALMDPLIKNSLVKNSPVIKKKMVNLIKLQQKMQDYLHQLKPACMDFLDWHEAVPNHTPAPKC